MDEFAQTRGGDDLFDDEITPITESIADLAINAPTSPSREGRDRGRGSRGDRGRGQSRSDGQAHTKEESGTQEDAGPSPNDTPKVQAVRGDRSGTGGVKKAKLTEDELSQRMAAAKLNSAKRSAAHARAEADEALFQEREKIAQEKRRMEGQNRRVMDGEREKNRMRKLNAQTGREWDKEKNDEDFKDTRLGRGNFRRGAYGGVSYDGNRTYGRNWAEESQQAEAESNGGRGSFAPRGRGGRGKGRSDRGRGRGDFQNANGAQTRKDARLPTPAIGKETEFPALPGGDARASGTSGTKSNVSKHGETDISQPPPMTEGTWADQVESSEAAPPEAGW